MPCLSRPACNLSMSPSPDFTEAPSKPLRAFYLIILLPPFQNNRIPHLSSSLVISPVSLSYTQCDLGPPKKKNKKKKQKPKNTKKNPTKKKTNNHQHKTKQKNNHKNHKKQTHKKQTTTTQKTTQNQKNQKPTPKPNTGSCLPPHSVPGIGHFPVPASPRLFFFWGCFSSFLPASPPPPVGSPGSLLRPPFCLRPPLDWCQAIRRIAKVSPSTLPGLVPVFNFYRLHSSFRFN